MRLLVRLGCAVLAFAWPSCVRADTTPLPAPTQGPFSVAIPSTTANSAQPLLFFQQKPEGTAASDKRSAAIQQEVHDRLVPALAELFETKILTLNGSAYSSTELMTLCRSTGAVGVLVFDSAWEMEGSSLAVAPALDMRSCGGTVWLSVGSKSVKDTNKDSEGNVADDVTYWSGLLLVVKLSHQFTRTPDAWSNFVKHGFYMNDHESDSFWTLAIENGQTIVDSCDPVGTAYRAGLRIGDNVTAIDGEPTVPDQARLNGILQAAKRKGPWELTVRTEPGSTKTIRFENEPVSWYATHPFS